MIYQGEELEFSVGDMSFAAKRWGPDDGLPLMALHGWLDNAASFDVLAPMLARFQVVAVDLAGHGKSSHRSANSQYLIWAELLELLDIADQCGWGEFAVIGHSRGAMIATLLTLAAPERIQGLVCLDAFLPPPSDLNDSAKNLREYIRDERRYLSRRDQNLVQKPIATLEAAVAVRQKVMPMEYASARLILERGLRPVAGGYVWRHDERLKGRSAFKLSAGHNDALLAELCTPALVILSPYYRQFAAKQLEKLVQHPHLKVVELAGNHHFHMEAQAADTAEMIDQFLPNDRQ